MWTLIPSVISRNQWGSRYSPGGYKIGKVARVVIHHYYRPDIKPGSSQAQEIGALRGVEKYHADKSWGGGTGYNFHIAESGRIYEGRGLFRSGAHTVGQNSKSIGIALMIDGDTREPTAAAWASVRWLIDYCQRQGALTSQDYSLYGHTDFAAKSCPGKKTYPLLKLRIKEGTTNPNYLQKGDTGPYVAKWQQFLHDWRKLVGGTVAPIAIDGDFGNLTRNETERFQRWAGLTIDGIVGPETLNAAQKVNFITEPEKPEPEEEKLFNMLLFTRRQDAIDLNTATNYMLLIDSSASITTDLETAKRALGRGEKVVAVGVEASKLLEGTAAISCAGANAKETQELLFKLA